MFYFYFTPYKSEITFFITAHHAMGQKIRIFCEIRELFTAAVFFRFNDFAPSEYTFHPIDDALGLMRYL